MSTGKNNRTYASTRNLYDIVTLGHFPMSASYIMLHLYMGDCIVVVSCCHWPGSYIWKGL